MQWMHHYRYTAVKDLLWLRILTTKKSIKVVIISIAAFKSVRRELAKMEKNAHWDRTNLTQMTVLIWMQELEYFLLYPL